MWRIIVVVGTICVPLNHAIEISMDINNPANITDFRTDICNRAQLLLAGNYTIDTVLKGLELTFLVANTHEDAWFVEDADGTQRGFHMNIMNLVSERAGFSFTAYWQNASELLANKSWTQLFEIATTKFDLVINDGMETAERENLGLVVAAPFLDMSIVTSTYAEEDRNTVWDRVAGFTKPFHIYLWLCIVSAFFVTGFAYSIIEYGADHSVEYTHHGRKHISQHQSYIIASRSWFSRIGVAIYTSITQLCGSYSFAPKTGPGMLVIFTYSFLCLLILAAYTANLTSFLTVTKATNIDCRSIEECAKKGKIFCVYHGSAVEDWLYNNYPDLTSSNQIYSSVITHTSHGSIVDSYYEGLVSKKCDVVLSDKFGFNVAQVSKYANRDCYLQRLSIDPELKVRGGWMGAMDLNNKCTSILLDAIRNQINHLISEGIVDKEHEAYMSMRRNMPDCSIQKKTSTPELSVESLSGWFMVHVIILFVTVSYACFTSIQKPGNKTILLSVESNEPHSIQEVKFEQIEQLDMKLETLINAQRQERAILNKRLRAVESNMKEMSDLHASCSYTR